MSKLAASLSGPVFFLLCLSLFTINDNGLLNAAERKPIPDQGEVQEAHDEIRGFYRTEFRQARSATDKKGLAQELVDDANLADEDSVAQYTLLRLALDLAVETKDVELTLQITDSIASAFVISQAQVRAEALQSLAGIKADSNKQHQITLANESLSLVYPLLDERGFELAKRMASVAATAARNAKEYVLFRRARAVGREIDSIFDALQIISRTQKYLKDGGSFEAAKGKLECYVVGDWESGLALLSEGDDPDLKGLAEQTLSAMETEGFPVDLADEWWKIGEKQSGRRESVIKRFAAARYQDALASLEGLSEKRAESRIADAEEMRVAGILTREKDESVQDQVAGKGRAEKRPVRVRGGVLDNQKYTTFGNLKLSKQEIEVFLNKWKAEKPKAIQNLQFYLNSRESRMSAEEILRAQEMFKFVSRESVVIVQRTSTRRSGIGSVFKCGNPFTIQLPYGRAETRNIIDKQSALISLENDTPVVIKGIDTSRLPQGKWQCHLLLKRVADEVVPGIVGNKSVRVFQAVSSEGFPKDIILW